MQNNAALDDDEIIARFRRTASAWPKIANPAQAPVPDAADETEFLRLAALTPVEYDRARTPTAKALRISVGTLDAEIKKRRPAEQDDTKQGAAVIFDDLPPWEQSVNGAVLLDEVEIYVSRHLALPDHASVVITLWAAHAHCFRAFDYTPRLNITSLEKGCGKTETLDVLQTLAPRAIRTEGVSTAVLFRLTDQYAPTLLIDECDSSLRENEELRSALNAGHKRGGVFLRCEGDNYEPRAFKTFAPVALAGIGNLPGTLFDRSIATELKRALPGEIKEHLELRKTVKQELKRKLARWAADNMAELEQLEPVLPGGFHNRRADKWRALFAVAQLVGGHWPKSITEAAKALSESEDAGDSIRMQLLAALRAIFARTVRDKLPTQEIIDELVKDEEAPWKTYHKGSPVTPRTLARLLRPFGAKSGSKRDGNSTFKGYDRKDFEEAFKRFLPALTGYPPKLSVTESQRPVHAGFEDIASVTVKKCVTDKKTPEAAPALVCDGVTDRNSLSGGQVESAEEF